MISYKNALSAAFVAGILALTPAAQAATIGVPVDSFVTQNPVGIFATGGESLLGDGAIKYFNPLNGGTSGTYGVDAGVAQDIGFGGGTLDMYLSFTGVSTTSASVLEIVFEDLDLINVNDPNGFLESVEVFNGSGVSVTGLIDTLGPLVVGTIVGNDDIQTFALALGVLATDPYFVRLQFKTPIGTTKWKNTPEYLTATISAVPLPAAGWMMLTGIVGLAGMGLRRRSKKADIAA